MIILRKEIKMKKIIAILLILIMAFALVACNEEVPDDGSTPQLPGNDSGSGDDSGLDLPPRDLPPASLEDIDNAWNNN